jgi:hypothetical protein
MIATVSSKQVGAAQVCRYGCAPRKQLGCGQIQCLDRPRQTYKASRDQRGLRVRGKFDGCVSVSVCSELVMKESRALCDGQDSGIHIP